MKNATRYLAAPAVLALAVFAGQAWAQQATPTEPTTNGSAAASMHHVPKHADRADIVEQRIADLHAKLKITDQQSKQWDAFAQTMRDNAQKTDQAFRDRAEKLSTQSADDAMKSYAALAQLHADNMQKLSAALSDLYAALSPEQKQIADEMYRNNGGGRHHPGAAPHKHKAGGAPAAAGTSSTPASS